jgi:phage terminase large subunit GpA-like protein
MDAVCEPGIEEVVVIKAAQVGFSESLRNILGFWIDREPGPCLVVMPDQKSAEELIEERIKPLLEFTPAVTRHVTSRAWDVKKSSIRLDTMSVYIGWAGSSQALKSRPIRYLLLEEPDEYVAVSGAGGDPISKAMKRITTYAAKGRARVVIGGTPTTRLGNTWKAWESCGDRRHFWVPCPHCGKFQRLYWKQVHWEPARDGEGRIAHAARVLATGAAWYACEYCDGRIVEAQKSAALQRGVWAGEDQVVSADGRVVGPASSRRRVGFCLPAMYSPWVSFAKLAAEWIEAQGDVQALADFVNQRLAEPFEEQRSKTEPTFIEQKARGAPEPMLVPKWARLLLASADTQGTSETDGYFWYVIRAWGLDYRSQLIDFGIAESKDALIERCLRRQVRLEEGAAVAPQMLCVDSGGPRWSEIYQLAQSDPRIRPTKGAAANRTWMVTERKQDRHKIILWEIDTEQAKDLLHRLIHDPDQTKWLPHCKVTDDYCRQMCSESKVFDPRDKREKWVEIVKNNNHLWDCEAIQAAVAWRMNMGLPEPPGADRPTEQNGQEPPANWLTSYRRW